MLSVHDHHIYASGQLRLPKLNISYLLSAFSFIVFIDNLLHTVSMEIHIEPFNRISNVAGLFTIKRAANKRKEKERKKEIRERISRGHICSWLNYMNIQHSP